MKGMINIVNAKINIYMTLQIIFIVYGSCTDISNITAKSCSQAKLCPNMTMILPNNDAPSPVSYALNKNKNSTMAEDSV